MTFPVPLRQMLPLLGITVSAFVFNTSEFMPIALLMDISQSFDQTEAETGIMITVYAWMVAILSLPLMLAAGKMKEKTLLLLTLLLFALGQLASGMAPSFPLLMGARILVASAHAIFWSIAAPLAARLVDKGKSPFALSMVAAGTAVAMVFGLPLGRVIGLALGWRMTFLLIALVTAGAMVYLFFVFPQLSPGEPFTPGDLPGLFRNRPVAVIFGMTIFYASAYFTVYSYIEPFLHAVAHLAPAAITAVLIFLGSTGFLGSFAFSKMFGTYPKLIIMTGACGLLVPFFLLREGAPFLPVLLFCLLAMGVVNTLYGIAMQSEIIRHLSTGAAPVAMSIFSGIFNMGIGSGTYIGSLLTARGYLPYIGLAGGLLALACGLLCIFGYLPFMGRKSRELRNRG